MAMDPGAAAAMTSSHRLVEAMPPRAIDLHPRLAGAVDSLSALRDTHCANAFVQIALRADTWISHRLGRPLPRLRFLPEEASR
jgi:hypothetical protein